MAILLALFSSIVSVVKILYSAGVYERIQQLVNYAARVVLSRE